MPPARPLSFMLATSNNSMRPSEKYGRIMALIVIVAGISVLVWNYSYGDMISGWYREYIDSNGNLQGSGKWRGAMGSQFCTFAFISSPFVYMLSIPSSIMLVKNSFPVVSKIRTSIYMGMSLINIFVLLWFLYLGVWTSVSEL